MNYDITELLRDHRWNYWGFNKKIGKKQILSPDQLYKKELKSLKECIAELKGTSSITIVHYDFNKEATHILSVRDATRMLKLNEL